jgi:DNA invertase Pin-like site-specific DNA recombinase
MSDKIRPQHLERKAILYIRQSSAYQVTHNLESQKLQYAMEERLRQLGWREIAAISQGRPGFQPEDVETDSFLS